MKKVIIEVLGGVASVAECPDNVEVEIIDYDNINDEEEMDRLANESANMMDAAFKIYSNIYGDIDNKFFKDKIITEIFDWLCNGDLERDGSIDVEHLTKEWIEYSNPV